MAYNPLIELEEKENHSIDEASLVTSVHYNGTQLDKSLYVKRGTDLNFVIDYKYIENPKSTVIVEYVDIDGVKLGSDESLTGYVNDNMDVIIKDFTGYNFVKIDNDLNMFPENDSTVKVIYEKFTPEPEVEEEIEEENNYESIEKEEENEDGKDIDDEENKNKRENVNS